MITAVHLRTWFQLIRIVSLSARQLIHLYYRSALYFRVSSSGLLQNNTALYGLI